MAPLIACQIVILPQHVNLEYANLVPRPSIHHRSTNLLAISQFGKHIALHHLFKSFDTDVGAFSIHLNIPKHQRVPCESGWETGGWEKCSRIKEKGM